MVVELKKENKRYVLAQDAGVKARGPMQVGERPAVAHQVEVTGEEKSRW